jgi:hypothetical protein
MSVLVKKMLVRDLRVQKSCSLLRLLQTLIQSLWSVDYCRVAGSSHISTALPVCLSSDGSNNQRVVRWKFSLFNLGWRKGIGCGGGHCWKCGSKNRHGGGRFGLLLLYKIDTEEVGLDYYYCTSTYFFIYLIYVICIYILLSFFDYFGVNVNNSYCIFLTVVIMLVVVMAFETFIHFIYQFL